MNKLTRCLLVGTAVLGLSASGLATAEPLSQAEAAYQGCQCPPPRFEGKGPEGGRRWHGPEALFQPGTGME